jgi:hypothetical protein
MSRGARIGFLVAAIVVIVVAIVIIKPGSDKTKTSPPTTVVVKNAKPVGGIEELHYNKGDTIDLTVQSDTADEVHFHGYDVHKDVEKGGSVHFKFKATIDGQFIVELEDHTQTLADVTVEP